MSWYSRLGVCQVDETTWSFRLEVCHSGNVLYMMGCYEDTLEWNWTTGCNFTIQRGNEQKIGNISGDMEDGEEKGGGDKLRGELFRRVRTLQYMYWGMLLLICFEALHRGSRRLKCYVKERTRLINLAWDLGIGLEAICVSKQCIKNATIQSLFQLKYAF